MNAKVVGLAIALVGFVSLTGLAVAEHGYVGFFDWATHNSATRLMFTDLTIALTLFLVWMVRDARERGLTMLPYLIVTLFFGAAGPLGYLIHRELSSSPVPSRA